jgi:hypothetical protein
MMMPTAITPGVPLAMMVAGMLLVRAWWWWMIMVDVMSMVVLGAAEAELAQRVGGGASSGKFKQSARSNQLTSCES